MNDASTNHVSCWTAGTFEAEQDAAAAYDSACRKMYGMQAIVNFASAPAKPIQGGKDADLELAAMEGSIRPSLIPTSYSPSRTYWCAASSLHQCINGIVCCSTGIHVK